ncbi:putative bifunctional diguanylate cyclase/phosphodiesterase [Arthrobacter sp. BPSS-3]|uniref:putative bifunctional diguanylate cyclase/phosphodiesterase n=1 Tax=Arthrobacter sp. BPSS-3 TaxID=3366580 RepID=UPI0037DD0F4B
MNDPTLRAVRAASASRRLRIGFSAALLAGAAIFSAGVFLRESDAFSPLVDGFLSQLTEWLPAAVCWFMALRRRGRGPELALVAGALSCQAAGDTYYMVLSATGQVVPVPSPADIGYIGFYILFLAALWSIVRRRLASMAWPVVLDGIVGGLGAAAVLAVLMDPVMAEIMSSGQRSATAVIGAVYPLLDLLLAATVLGIAATPGRVLGRGWILLVTGLLLYTAADVVYIDLQLRGLYAVGTPLDLAWAVGTALIGCWAAFHGTPRRRSLRDVSCVPVQAVPGLATLAGLGVLLLGTQVHIMLLAVVLAGLTLASAALPLVFRQRIRLLDATRQARTDELTGLPNRRALYSDVPGRLSDVHRSSAVLLLDLDKFKEVNDGLGHHVGDELLKHVAARLVGTLRPEDFLARMGGDEFLVHLADCGPRAAETVALALRDALGEAFDLGGVVVQVNASIGIASFPEHGTELGLLMRKADMAMYAAKSTRSGHALYTGVTGGPGKTHFHSVQSLNEALSQGQLVLHFQPKLELGTGEVRGVEALVRWDHPTLGLLQPDAFLDRFEEAGLMPALTEVVLGAALDQAARWEAQKLGMSVAVNLSARSIMDSRLPAKVAAMADARGLPASVLVVEITEDVLVADRARATAVLAALRRMGVKIAVDDFGKGFSSLSYLRELPLDELKLDKSFIFTMLDDARATALVVSTIDLAHSLGFEMTAEGVESEEVYRALADFGCDLAQGYFISRPVPAGELTAWLASRGSDEIAGFAIATDVDFAGSARP